VEQAIPIHLAVEDPLSEAMLRAILLHSGRSYTVGSCYSRGGNGYLKKTIDGFNQGAKGCPFLVLTDLDRGPCAPGLITEWLAGPKHPNLLFRVAVRAVESWVLADRGAFGAFIGVDGSRIPADTDGLEDPKQFLVSLVSRSRNRDLRAAIVPRKGSTAKQGPDYNRPLIEFIQGKWRAQRAATASQSLRRAFEAVRLFQQTAVR